MQLTILERHIAACERSDEDQTKEMEREGGARVMGIVAHFSPRCGLIDYLRAYKYINTFYVFIRINI